MNVDAEVIAAQQWRQRVYELRQQGAHMFDFLTAIDRPLDDEMEIVVHLVDLGAGRRHRLHARVPRGSAVIDSLCDLYAGAAWHEREAAEMFGVSFRGNTDRRALLTTGASDFPLLRSTPLRARTVTAWPGAAEPMPASTVEGPPRRTAARVRARLRPPGTPAEWEGAAAGDGAVDGASPGQEPGPVRAVRTQEGGR